MTSTDGFPISARVMLHSLKREDLNGKIGVVRSAEVSNGRQQVYVIEAKKAFALKLENLKHEERDLDGLSVRELQSILRLKNVAFDAIDKSELRSKVRSATNDASPVEIARLLAQANKPAAPRTGSMVNKAAEQLSTMSPEQLRQQAQMMRTMPPEQIRRMNPGLAHMSDAQIRMAAQQMEMMASNPAAMKAAADKMKNMSQDEVDRLQRQAGMNPSAAATSRTTPDPRTATPSTGDSAGSSSPAASVAAAPSPATASATNPQQAADVMSQMSPEQLRQQVQMMRTMSPDTIRQMNPQLAHMTDAQISMAADQMEMMANNPEMMKMAMDQMKNMSPEDIRKMQAGQMPPQATVAPGSSAGASSPTVDPSKMLADMDPKQLKTMLASIQNDPEQLKNFAKMSGIPEAQLKKGIDMFAGMDDRQMEAAMNVMGKAQQAKEAWTKVDAKVGGHLMKITVVVGLFVLYLLYQGIALYFFNSASTVPVSSASIAQPDPIPAIPVHEESEF